MAVWRAHSAVCGARTRQCHFSCGVQSIVGAFRLQGAVVCLCFRNRHAVSIFRVVITDIMVSTLAPVATVSVVKSLAVQALEKLAHDCHTSCQACLKKHGNLESAGVGDGSPNEGGPLHFQGDAAQWQQLVDQ